MTGTDGMGVVGRRGRVDQGVRDAMVLDAGRVIRIVRES